MFPEAVSSCQKSCQSFYLSKNVKGHVKEKIIQPILQLYYFCS